MAEKKLKEIAAIVSQFELEDLRMIECQCAEPRLEPTGLPSFLHLPTNVTTAIDRKNHRLRVEISFALYSGYSEMVQKDPNENAAIHMKAKFRLILKFANDSSQSEEDISAFGHRSGVITAWPLWREFVMTMTARLGLPPLTVPLLNIPGLLAGAEEKPKEPHQKRFEVTKKKVIVGKKRIPAN